MVEPISTTPPFLNNSNYDYEGHNSSVGPSTHQSDLPELEALSFVPWQIILIAIYSATAVISLGSNVLTIVILLRGEHVSTELWKFLLNLSFAGKK